MNECGARTRSGGACKRASRENGRCKLHGGASPGGPLTKGGRYSKFLPQRLAARYEEARADALLVSTAEEIAALDARLSELFERLGTTETSRGWALAWKLRQQEKMGGPEGVKARLLLDEILEAGFKDSQQWGEIGAIIEQRRKCAETEQKRLAQAEQFITAKQANVLMAAIVKLVTENVPDPDARKRIAAGLAQLVHGPDSGGDSAGGGAVN